MAWSILFIVANMILIASIIEYAFIEIYRQANNEFKDWLGEYERLIKWLLLLAWFLYPIFFIYSWYRMLENSTSMISVIILIIEAIIILFWYWVNKWWWKYSLKRLQSFLTDTIVEGQLEFE